MHKNFHKNVRYKCCETGCNVEADTKLHIEEHQAQVGHIGIAAIETLEEKVSKK